MTPGPGSSRRTADGTAVRHPCVPVPAWPAGGSRGNSTQKWGPSGRTRIPGRVSQGRISEKKAPGGARGEHGPCVLLPSAALGLGWDVSRLRPAACPGPGRPSALPRPDGPAALSALPLWAALRVRRPSLPRAVVGGVASSPYSRTLRGTQLCASAGWTSGMC